jgi:D-xylose 1-dehydrogenase (NADP+, D-xylono-1,5-lactone-forming)
MSSDTPPLRWGLLSTAHVNRRVIPAIRANPDSVLGAVASRDLARARTYARTWDIPRAHGSYEALLDDEHVDAIYLSLPNALHVEWTLRAIDAGKHVLCEKPLALDPRDVDRIAVAAHRRGVIVTEAFMYRHEPLTDRVLALVAGDAIGPLRSVNALFTYRRTRADDVRLVPELGGGCLWDVGCYTVSFVRLVAGVEPVEVFGWATSGVTGVDEAFTGMLRFPGDVMATIHTSFRSEYRHWVDIAGADAALRVANPFKPSPQETVELRRGDLTHSVSVAGSAELFVRQIEDFAGSVRDGRAPRISLDESRGNAATLAALYESARTGRPVAIAAP